MIGKHGLKSLISDIDKIISGELIISSDDYKHDDEEYKELLMLAQLLHKADFPVESPERMKRIWADLHNGQMEDDELDMVAGGVNPNAVLDEKDKKVF